MKKYRESPYLEHLAGRFWKIFVDFSLFKCAENEENSLQASLSNLTRDQKVVVLKVWSNPTKSNGLEIFSRVVFFFSSMGQGGKTKPWGDF